MCTRCATAGRSERVGSIRGLCGILHSHERHIPILIDPEIQGGTPCFSGTRVPVKSLFDALAQGRSVDYFLQQFPRVRAEQVSDVLATRWPGHSRSSLTSTSAASMLRS